jgi:putative transposase
MPSKLRALAIWLTWAPSHSIIAAMPHKCSPSAKGKEEMSDVPDFNRSVGRMKLFRQDGDFEAFERVILQAHQRYPLRILSYCIMSNHWHFVVWPKDDSDVTDFFRWLAHTHAMRWRVSHRTVGYGHLYQGRFKSFPVQQDDHLLTLCRYVERNPLAAGLVKRSEQWRWSSLWTRLHGDEKMKSLLTNWPVDRPTNWIDLVNRPLGERDTELVKTSMDRGRPLGGDGWVDQMIRHLDLRHTIRAEGRPKKEPKK